MSKKIKEQKLNLMPNVFLAPDAQDDPAPKKKAKAKNGAKLKKKPKAEDDGKPKKKAKAKAKDDAKLEKQAKAKGEDKPKKKDGNKKAQPEKPTPKRCPCCSKHCKLKKPHCKKGKRLAAKLGQ
jgi:hypothetical protein